jgi:hypothetical protein
MSLSHPRPATTEVAGHLPPCPPPAPDDLLLRVAHLLVEAHDVESGPTLVRMAVDATRDGDADDDDADDDDADDDDADIALGVLAVPDGLDPYDLLACAHTSDEWEVLGMVFTGRLLDLPDTAHGPARRRPGRSVGAILVHRDGSSVSVLDDGDHVREIVTEPSEVAPVGRLADALRRSLGLSTAPPAIGVGAVVARVWLHRVHTVAVDGRPLDADVVVALKPPMPRSWSELRSQCVDGGWVELTCDPDLAAWMDDGMFSRWCLSAFPDPLDALVDLTELVEPCTAEPLAEALSAWR